MMFATICQLCLVQESTGSLPTTCRNVRPSQHQTSFTMVTALPPQQQHQQQQPHHFSSSANAPAYSKTTLTKTTAFRRSLTPACAPPPWPCPRPSPHPPSTMVTKNLSPTCLAPCVIRRASTRHLTATTCTSNNNSSSNKQAESRQRPQVTQGRSPVQALCPTRATTTTPTSQTSTMGWA